MTTQHIVSRVVFWYRKDLAVWKTRSYKMSERRGQQHKRIVEFKNGEPSTYLLYIYFKELSREDEKGGML